MPRSRPPAPWSSIRALSPVLALWLTACASTDATLSEAPGASQAVASTRADAPAIPKVSDDPVVQRIVELGHGW